MCLCTPHPVHIYNSSESLLRNIIGTQLHRHWFGPPTNVFVPFESCCPDGYLPAAFVLGYVSLAAIVLAIIIGFVWKSHKRPAIWLSAFWLLLVGGSIAADYSEMASDYNRRAAGGRLSQGVSEYLTSYLAAVPVQLAFDMLILLLLPAALGYAARRIVQWLTQALHRQRQP